MTERIKVGRKDVQRIIDATFPSYRGRTIKVLPQGYCALSDLNWSGGTRSQYRACTVDGQPLTGGRDLNTPPPWDNPSEGKRVEIPGGHVIVEHCIFCGKDLGLRIYCAPGDMPKLLPNHATV